MHIILILITILITAQHALFAEIKVEPINFNAKQEDIDEIKYFAQHILLSKDELKNLQNIGPYRILRLSSYKRADIKIKKNVLKKIEFYSLKCGSSYLTLCRHPRIEWDSEVGKTDRLFLLDSLDKLSNLQNLYQEKLSNKAINILKVTEKNPLWGEENPFRSFSSRYDTWNYNRDSREPFFVFDKNNILLYVIMPGDNGSIYLSDWVILHAKDVSTPKFYRVKLRDMPKNILKIFNNKTLDRFIQILNSFLGKSSEEGTIMYTSFTRTRALNVLLQSLWMPWKKYDFTLAEGRGVKTVELSVDLIFKVLIDKTDKNSTHLAEELKAMWPNVLLALENFYQHAFCLNKETAHEYATINRRAILHNFFDDCHYNYLEHYFD
jgi:hypothetical protein